MHRQTGKFQMASRTKGHETRADRRRNQLTTRTKPQRNAVIRSAFQPNILRLIGTFGPARIGFRSHQKKGDKPGIQAVRRDLPQFLFQFLKDVFEKDSEGF